MGTATHSDCTVAIKYGIGSRECTSSILSIIGARERASSLTRPGCALQFVADWPGNFLGHLLCCLLHFRVGTSISLTSLAAHSAVGPST